MPTSSRTATAATAASCVPVKQSPGNSHAGMSVEGSTGHMISGNTINSNLNRGIYLPTSPDNDLPGNMVCFNAIAN